MTATERRLATRFNFKLPLRVRISKSAAPERAAESLNVSARWMYFATDLPLQKGTPVQLVFAMPEEVSHKPTADGTAQVMLFMSSRAVHPRAQSV